MNHSAQGLKEMGSHIPWSKVTKLHSQAFPSWYQLICQQKLPTAKPLQI
jgi:hypothetical protein